MTLAQSLYHPTGKNHGWRQDESLSLTVFEERVCTSWTILGIQSAGQYPVGRFMPNLFPLHVPFTGTPLIVTMGTQQTYLCSENGRSPLVGQLPYTRLSFVSAAVSAPGREGFQLC